MNILIVRLSALGDVTHAFPALTTLRRAHPDAHITWLAEDSATEMILGHPDVSEVLTVPRREWKNLFRHFRLLSLVTSLRRFIRRLRSRHYQLVIDFQGLLKSAVWVAAARGDIKAGYGPGQRHGEFAWLALNRRIPVSAPNAHAVERNLLLLDGLGFPRLPVVFNVPKVSEHDSHVDALLLANGLPCDSSFVAISSMTRWPTKNWSPERFAATADAIIGAGLPVVFTGGPGDRADIDLIQQRMKKRAVRVDGRTPLPILTALLRRARVVLSTDTGPMHIAVAVGTPVVALFGPTSPEYTGPFGNQNVVLRAGVSCSPCFRRSCSTRDFEPHACMLRLEPDLVARHVLRLSGHSA